MASYSTTRNFVYDLIATVAFLATYYVMMPVFPIYMLKLGIDKFTIGVIIAFFSFSSLVARPLGGTWVDGMGRRRLMLLSIALFFLTPLLLRFPVIPVGFSLAQMVYGFTVGAFTVAATTFVADISSPATVAQFMGYHSIACITAKGLAPALGVKLMEIYGFDGPVITTVILALIAALFAFLLRDAGGKAEERRSYGFTEVLIKKNVYLPTLVLFCGLVTFGAISAMLPVFADERGISGIEYFFVINTVAVVATRLVMGPWSNRHLEKLVAVSLVLLTVSFVSMSFVSNFYQLIAVAIVYGLGYAVLFPVLSALLVLNISVDYRGMALGIYTAAFDLGVAMGAMLGGLSQYVDFKWLYLVLSLIPLTGYFVFQYLYLPFIKQGSRAFSVEKGAF
ncbi:MFS transporter [Thermoanaerobacterium sp. DL9XJH110]|uniref:MFS transporter n=1 Tax=Thermoanaerobacterium sp. DL9XJH110 TaxID=3386643 RepID=UPI003BB603E9